MPWTKATLLCAVMLAASAAGAQHTQVLVDAAHGGTDAGARLSPTLLEKDVTLSFANQVAAALKAKGLDVVQTRTSDTLLTVQQRTSQAAQVCLVLHATSSGTGVHVFTAMPPPLDPTGPILTPWNFVQHSMLGRSQAF